MKKGTPKKDGSGQGKRLNKGSGGCKTTKKIGQGRKGGKMKQPIKMTYNTADEMEFIRKLGTFRIYGNESRKSLLQKYIKTAKDRITWGRIHKQTIIDFANKLLSHDLLAEGDS